MEKNKIIPEKEKKQAVSSYLESVPNGENAAVPNVFQTPLKIGGVNCPPKACCVVEEAEEPATELRNVWNTFGIEKFLEIL